MKTLKWTGKLRRFPDGLALFQNFITSTRHARRSNTFRQLRFATMAVNSYPAVMFLVCRNVLHQTSVWSHRCFCFLGRGSVSVLLSAVIVIEGGFSSEMLTLKVSMLLLLSSSWAQMCSLGLQYFCFILYSVSLFRWVSWIYSGEATGKRLWDTTTVYRNLLPEACIWKSSLCAGGHIKFNNAQRNG